MSVRKAEKSISLGSPDSEPLIHPNPTRSAFSIRLQNRRPTSESSVEICNSWIEGVQGVGSPLSEVNLVTQNGKTEPRFPLAVSVANDDDRTVSISLSQSADRTRSITLSISVAQTRSLTMNESPDRTRSIDLNTAMLQEQVRASKASSDIKALNFNRKTSAEKRSAAQPFIQAVRYGDISTVGRLLKAFGNPLLVFAENLESATASSLAVSLYGENFDLCRSMLDLLVEYGENITRKNEAGQTPLDISICLKNSQIAQHLFSLVKQSDSSTTQILGEAILKAAKSGSGACIESFLFKCETFPSQYSSDMIDRVVRRREEDYCRQISGKTNVLRRSSKAAMGRAIEDASLLHRHEIDKKLLPYFESALRMAKANGYERMVQVLLAHGVMDRSPQ